MVRAIISRHGQVSPFVVQLLSKGAAGEDSLSSSSSSSDEDDVDVHEELQDAEFLQTLAWARGKVSDTARNAQPPPELKLAPAGSKRKKHKPILLKDVAAMEARPNFMHDGTWLAQICAGLEMFDALLEGLEEEESASDADQPSRPYAQELEDFRQSLIQARFCLTLPALVVLWSLPGVYFMSSCAALCRQQRHQGRSQRRVQSCSQSQPGGLWVSQPQGDGASAACRSCWIGTLAGTKSLARMTCSSSGSCLSGWDCSLTLDALRYACQLQGRTSMRAVDKLCTLQGVEDDDGGRPAAEWRLEDDQEDEEFMEAAERFEAAHNFRFEVAQPLCLHCRRADGLGVYVICILDWPAGSRCRLCQDLPSESR